MKNYDLIVLGSGPGGYVAAIKAGQKNLKVAIIEKEAIGGVCLNWGCIPTKSLLKSAKVYTEFQNAKDYGIIVSDMETVKPDWKAIISRKNRIVKRLTGGVKMLLQKNKVDIINGVGEIINKNEIMVNDEKFHAKNIIISTGAYPAFPPIDGLLESYEKKILLTSKELLEIEEIPEKLVIIGGGVIGIEFATIFNSFGSEVTIIEREDKILLNVDNDVRETMMKVLKKAKIETITGASVLAIDLNKVSFKNKDGQTKTIETSKILLSTGMKANTESFKKLNLKVVKNFVEVDSHMKTSLDNIYAIGDVNGKMMLAHVASHQATIAVNHILGFSEEINYDQVPSAIYSFPEIAQVGLTEEEAKKRGVEYKVANFPLQANGKALSANEKDGFIKIIASKQYNEIIGCHIMADNASDLISEAVMVMKLEGTADEIAKSIHPHPTISEIFHEAALGIIDKPIHI
jgi:dihydrolipoamide dehydrogenase